MTNGVKVGRNEKCPCGSGEKFKNCCLNESQDVSQSGASSAKATWSLKKSPGKKIDPVFPPDWMEKQYASIQERLSGRTNLDAFWKEYKSLNRDLGELPSNIVSPEYRTTDIKKIAEKMYDGDMLLAASSLYEFEIRKMYLTNIYKIKSVVSSINVAFETGNFTTASILMRSFLEIVSYLFYFKKKFSDKSNQFRSLILQSEKIKLNTLEREKWAKRLGNLSDDFIKQLTKSNFGTSYDWKSRIHDHYGDTLDRENHNVGKLNTLTAIQLMAKESKVDFEGTYNLFSEMMHPNFGSHTLVVKTRKTFDGICSDVYLGDMDKDIEQTIWFFDCFANGAYETAKICRNVIAEYSEIMRWYERFNDLQLQLLDEKRTSSKPRSW